MVHNISEARQLLNALTEEERYLHRQLNQITGIDMTPLSDALSALIRILYRGTNMSLVGAPQCYDALQTIAGKLMKFYDCTDSHRFFSWGTVSVGSGSNTMIRYSPSEFTARIQKLTAEAKTMEELSKELKQEAAVLMKAENVKDMTIVAAKMEEMSRKLSEFGGVIMTFADCLTKISRNYATAQGNAIAYALQIPE